MPWEDLQLKDAAGKRRSLVDALREYYSGDGNQVVAVDASLAKGRAYFAIHTADGQARPMYLWLESAENFGTPSPEMEPYLMYKVMPIEESPTRWPRKVAEALTTWEP